MYMYMYVIYTCNNIKMYMYKYTHKYPDLSDVMLIMLTNVLTEVTVTITQFLYNYSTADKAFSTSYYHTWGLCSLHSQTEYPVVSGKHHVYRCMHQPPPTCV